MAERRQYSREFKLEAIRLVTERGVTAAQAACDLDLHENLLRKRLKADREDAGNAFPGAGVQARKQAAPARLRKEIAKLRMERDILKKAAAFFAQDAL